MKVATEAPSWTKILAATEALIARLTGCNPPSVGRCSDKIFGFMKKPICNANNSNLIYARPSKAIMPVILI